MLWCCWDGASLGGSLSSGSPIPVSSPLSQTGLVCRPLTRGGHRLGLEGTRSPVPSSIPSSSWLVSPRSSFRSPLKQPEHGVGGAPRPPLTPPVCRCLAVALDSPGGAEQALSMIGEDQE